MNQHRTRLKALSLIVVLLSAFWLSGCSSNKGTNQASDSPGTIQKEVILKSWAFSDDGSPIQQGIIDDFMKQNPNIKIETEFLPNNGGPEKIQVAVAGNEAPDMLFDMNGRLLTFASQGRMVPLDDIITPEQKQDIDEKVWQQAMVSGKTYMFPSSSVNVGYMVNRSLFKEAGAENLLPQGPDKTWTFDQFKEALKAVTKDGIYGTAFYAGNEQADAFTFAWLWGLGAETFNEDFSKVILNSPEAAQALQIMLDISKEGLSMPGDATRDAGSALELFNQKKIAVTIGGVDNVNVVKKGINDGSIKEPFDVDLVMIPGDIPKSIAYVFGLSIFDNGDADKIAAAKKFVQFWSNQENLKKQGGFYTTSSKSVAADLYKDDPIALYATNVLSKYAGRYGAQVVGFPEIRAAFFPELQAAFVKGKTPQQALDDFTSKANEILEKYKK